MEAHEEIVRDFSAAVRQLGAADLAKWPADRRLKAMQMLVGSFASAVAKSLLSVSCATMPCLRLHCFASLAGTQ